VTDDEQADGTNYRDDDAEESEIADGSNYRPEPVDQDEEPDDPEVTSEVPEGSPEAE
jgi:hypothetical protein